jgi:membrane-associated phospholipid phosphatase
MNALAVVLAMVMAQSSPAPRTPGETTPAPPLPAAPEPVAPVPAELPPASGTAPGSAAPPAATTASPAGAPPWPAHGLPTVGVWDIVASGGLVGALAVVQFGVPAPTQGKWAGNGFDDWVRGGLRLSSESGRQTASTISDVGVYILSAFPLINATLVAGVEHERWDIAWRLVVLDAETLLTATLAAISLQHLTARERPFVQECVTNPNLRDCQTGSKYQSFPSGHTTLVFAAVALECFHHGYLDTSHTGWGAAACPATVAVAAVTGVLRVMADRHWATDVIAGAVLGGTIGIAIPALHIAVAKGQTPTVVTPAIGPGMMGLSIAGRW